MELEFGDGAAIPLASGAAIELGRGLAPTPGFGPYSGDRTVSRRHLALRLPGGNHGTEDETSVSFEVVGKNPIFVLSSSGGAGGGQRAYRCSEKGELTLGDSFSLSIKNPFFLKIRWMGVEKMVLDAVERREKRTAERRKEEREKESVQVLARGGYEEQAVGGIDSELESVDISQIDPVREFGFLVRGHEFDHYPRQKIPAIKDWKWFLEEPGESDDKDEVIDEGSAKGKKVGRRGKKDGGNDDEEWIGESEEERATDGRVGGDKRPKYATRSKDPKKPRNESKKRARKDDFDEEDVTLGGCIVNEKSEEEEEEEEKEEEEEDEEEYEDND